MRNQVYDIQSNTFVGGMNLDLNETVVKDNTYREAYNLRLASNSNAITGVLENVVGNRPVIYANGVNDISTYIADYIVVGDCVIRNYIVLFLRKIDGNGFISSKIVKIKFNDSYASGDNVEITSIEVVANDDVKGSRFNFGREIRTSAVFESSNNIRIYWTDFYSDENGDVVNPIRVVNISNEYNSDEDLETPDSTTSNIGGDLLPIYDINISAGRLYVGSYQYLYRFISNGVGLNYSPLTHVIPLTTAEYPLEGGDIWRFGGAPQYVDSGGTSPVNTNSNKGISFNIDVPDAYRDHIDSIEVYRIFYEDNEKYSVYRIREIDVREFYETALIIDYEFVGDDVVLIEDGISLTDKTENSGLNSSLGVLFAAKDISINKNTLFAANIKEIRNDVIFSSIDDNHTGGILKKDTRVYRFNKRGECWLFSYNEPQPVDGNRYNVIVLVFVDDNGNPLTHLPDYIDNDIFLNEDASTRKNFNIRTYFLYFDGISLLDILSNKDFTTFSLLSYENGEWESKLNSSYYIEGCKVPVMFDCVNLSNSVNSFTYYDGAYVNSGMFLSVTDSNIINKTKYRCGQSAWRDCFYICKSLPENTNVSVDGLIIGAIGPANRIEFAEKSAIIHQRAKENVEGNGITMGDQSIKLSNISTSDMNYYINHDSYAELSYMRDEIYSFGQILSDGTGLRSNVMWIGDIRMPHNGQSVYYSGGEANILYLKMYSDFNYLASESIEVVRCKRTNSDRSIKSQGIMTNIRPFSRDQSSYYGVPVETCWGSAWSPEFNLGHPFCQPFPDLKAIDESHDPIWSKDTGIDETGGQEGFRTTCSSWGKFSNAYSSYPYIQGDRLSRAYDIFEVGPTDGSSTLSSVTRLASYHPRAVQFVSPEAVIYSQDIQITSDNEIISSDAYLDICNILGASWSGVGYKTDLIGAYSGTDSCGRPCGNSVTNVHNIDNWQIPSYKDDPRWVYFTTGNKEPYGVTGSLSLYFWSDWGGGGDIEVYDYVVGFAYDLKKKFPAIDFVVGPSNNDSIAIPASSFGGLPLNYISVDGYWCPSICGTLNAISDTFGDYGNFFGWGTSLFTIVTSPIINHYWEHIGKNRYTGNPGNNNTINFPYDSYPHFMSVYNPAANQWNPGSLHGGLNLYVRVYNESYVKQIRGLNREIAYDAIHAIGINGVDRGKLPLDANNVIKLNLRTPFYNNEGDDGQGDSISNPMISTRSNRRVSMGSIIGIGGISDNFILQSYNGSKYWNQFYNSAEYDYRCYYTCRGMLSSRLILGLDSNFSIEDITRGPRHDQHTGWCCATGSEIPVVNLRANNNSQYSGNDYTSRQNRKYIGCNCIYNKDSDDVSCFGGDVFIGFWDYMYSKLPVAPITRREAEPKESFNSMALLIPLELYVNPRYFTGFNYSTGGNMYKSGYPLVQEIPDRYTANIGVSISTSSLSLDQDTDYQRINPSFQAKQSIYYSPFIIDLDEIIDNKNIESKYHFDTRIFSSNTKTYGEDIDSFSIFLSHNYKDYDSQYGPINNLLTHNNTLYFWQDNAFGIQSVMPRQLINPQSMSDEQAALVLGDGLTLDRYDYISFKYGNRDPYSITHSPSVLYWLDSSKKKILSYSQGGQVQELSVTGGVQSRLDKLFDPNKATMLAYDTALNEVNIFTYSKDRFVRNSTLIFNEKMGVFSGFYEYTPDWYISLDKSLLTLKDYKFWNHTVNNLDYDRNLWYGKHYPSVLNFIVNKSPITTKIFDSLDYLTRSYNGIGQENPLDTFDITFFRTESQYTPTSRTYHGGNSGVDDREIGQRFERREDGFTMNIQRCPMNTDSIFPERLRGKYMLAELQYSKGEDNMHNKFIIPYINTKFRYSIR